jgi:hypothetical protein
MRPGITRRVRNAVRRSNSSRAWKRDRVAIRVAIRDIHCAKKLGKGGSDVGRISETFRRSPAGSQSRLVEPGRAARRGDQGHSRLILRRKSPAARFFRCVSLRSIRSKSRVCGETLKRRASGPACNLPVAARTPGSLGSDVQPRHRLGTPACTPAGPAETPGVVSVCVCKTARAQCNSCPVCGLSGVQRVPEERCQWCHSCQFCHRVQVWPVWPVWPKVCIPLTPCHHVSALWHGAVDPPTHAFPG